VKVLLGALAAAALTASAAAADSFTPVRLGIHVSPTARVHQRLHISVSVSADPGVLDNRLGPLRIEVKLAPQCGGDFQSTTGITLLNKRLKPQPATGRTYSAVARGSVRPRARGSGAVCAYLEEAGDNRVWAHDESLSVKVVR
jgi:opacity protein-like surface antigen